MLASVSWGVASALSKVALEQLTPIDLFGVEVATGALVLGAVAVARGARPRRPDARVALLGVLAPGLSSLLFDIGIAHTAATHAALLIATDSVFTVALAASLLRERLDARLRLALLAGVVGTVLVSREAGGSAGSLAGDLLVVAASAAAAGSGVLARAIAPGRDPLRLTAAQMLAAAVVAVPLAALAGANGHSHLGRADASHLATALAVGVLASVVPWVLYNAAIGRVTATAAGLVLTLIPLFGALSSVIVLGEMLGSPQLAGGAFVVGAAVLTASHPDSAAG